MDEILEKKDLNLEYDPRKVYKSLIAQQETATGEAVKLPADATDEEIAKNENVRNLVDTRVGQLLEICDLLLKQVIGSVKTFPYGLRWIARRAKACLTERFKDAAKDKITATVGYILFYRFIIPAIINPDDLELTTEITMAQRVNLMAISKVLQMVANNKLFEGEAPEIVKLNKHIKTWSEKCVAILFKALMEPRS